MPENENKGLTLEEFDKLWNEANHFIQRVRGWSDHNVVIETTGSQIMADDYRVDSVSYTHLTLPTIYSV